MARFFKHIGEHNGKKVIIVQRALPGEEHLAASYRINVGFAIHRQFCGAVYRLLHRYTGKPARGRLCLALQFVYCGRCGELHL